MSIGLERVRDLFRASLPRDGSVSIRRIDRFDRTGVPVVQAIFARDGEATVVGHGYGLVPIEAEVGAIGELCEEVHVDRWIADAARTVGSFETLVAAHGTRGVCDPLTLCLPAGCAYAPDMPLEWVEGRWLADDAPVLVPIEWVAAHGHRSSAVGHLVTPITNGLGAGLDLAHATAHGIMEALQRDGNVVSYRALDRGVVVELDEVRDDDVRALLARLHADGIIATVKLASTDFGTANLYVVGDDRGAPASPLQVTACGEAAHPDRERGLRKALLEFCGSRARKVATHGPLDLCRAVMGASHVEAELARIDLAHEERRSLVTMAEWLDRDVFDLRALVSDTVLSERERVAFSSLPSTGFRDVEDPDARLRRVEAALSSEGLEAIRFDVSPPDGEIAAVRMVVPGLEAETMSYHRIGWRGVRRLRERDDSLVLDASQEGALRVLLRPEDEARAGGPAWFDGARADRLMGELYPLYRETGPYSVQAYRAQRGQR